MTELRAIDRAFRHIGISLGMYKQTKKDFILTESTGTAVSSGDTKNFVPL
jgi:hypothetical protein